MNPTLFIYLSDLVGNLNAAPVERIDGLAEAIVFFDVILRGRAYLNKHQNTIHKAARAYLKLQGGE